MAGALKKTYNLIAGLALLHLLALGGGIGYLVNSGRLDVERARKVVAMFGGQEEEAEQADGEQGEGGGAGATQPALVSRGDEQVRDEIRWRNTDRYRAQIEQRLKFINAARLDVDRRREAFERLKEKEQVERKGREREAVQPGYKKELEIISQLKPRVALKQIMTMSDADAARVMFQLNSRKVKRIFEAAKTDTELTKLTTVRRLIRDIQPSAAEMAASEGGF